MATTRRESHLARFKKGDGGIILRGLGTSSLFVKFFAKSIRSALSNATQKKIGEGSRFSLLFAPNRFHRGFFALTPHSQFSYILLRDGLPKEIGSRLYPQDSEQRWPVASRLCLVFQPRSPLSAAAMRIAHPEHPPVGDDFLR